jgi:CCR4-NOT transcriptional regulation complex NOT5 subunit
MNRYLAKIVYEIRCGEGNQNGQFDEQLRLIVALSKEEAFFKAQSIGQNEEEIFFNQKQQLVQWKFINVAELYKLSELIDGAELYSRIEESEYPDSYINMIHKKAEQILSTNSLEILDLV